MAQNYREPNSINFSKCKIATATGNKKYKKKYLRKNVTIKHLKF